MARREELTDEQWTLIDPAKIEAFAAGTEPSKAKETPKETTGKNTPVAQKVVRDAFTMLAADHDLFAEIQGKCLAAGLVVTKSEIVRAGLKYMTNLDGKMLKEIMKTVPKLKIGRPGFKGKI